MIDVLKKELQARGVVQFYVRARPSASCTKLQEMMDDGSVKISIAAPAEQGRANVELCKFLAKEFGVDISRVTIVSGQTTRVKLVRVMGNEK